MTDPISPQDFVSNAIAQQIQQKTDEDQRKLVEEELAAQTLQANLTAEARKDPLLNDASHLAAAHPDVGAVRHRRRFPGANLVEQDRVQAMVNAEVEKSSQTTTSSSKSKQS